MLMPVIMAGAISSLLSGFSIEAYQTFITNVGLKPLFTMVTDYTTNMMALYAVFAIGYGMASQLECAKTAVAAGLMSLMSFLLVIPLWGRPLWAASLPPCISAPPASSPP